MKKRITRFEIFIRLLLVAVILAPIGAAFRLVPLASAQSSSWPPEIVFTAAGAECYDAECTAEVISDYIVHFTMEWPGGGTPRGFFNAPFDNTSVILSSLTIAFSGDHPDCTAPDLTEANTAFGQTVGLAGGEFNFNNPGDGATTGLNTNFGWYACEPSSAGSVEFYWEVVEVNGFEAATPTPTPTGTTLATARPLSTQECVAGTPAPTRTPQPTGTPFSLTRTPVPTKTPKPQGTPGPTATPPGQAYDSGRAQFTASLAPWNVSNPHFTSLYRTEWKNTNGPDGSPGLAFLKDQIGQVGSTAIITTTANITGSLVLANSNLSFPIYINGYGKWSGNIVAGEEGYIEFWYFDPDYNGPGQGVWVYTGQPKPINSIWDLFSVKLTAHGGSGRVTAIAISESQDGFRNGEGLLLDDIRVTSGRTTHFPTCPGTGGSGTPTPPPPQVCIIKNITIDVFTGCNLPTDALDLIGWINYWFCWLGKYFTFGPDNRKQILDLQERQTFNEPIGTINETGSVFGVVKQTLDGVVSVNNGTDYRSFDWSTLLDWSAIDTAPLLVASEDDQAYMATCDAVIANVSQNAQRTACFVLSVVRDKFAPIVLLQWVIDGLAVFLLLTYVRKRWFADV